MRIGWCLLPVVAAACLAVPAAAAEGVLLPKGADFCLMRDYDAAHLSAHPGQIVSGLAIMGRNARAGAENPAGLLVASLVVRFVDQSAILALDGACYDRGPEAVACSFVPDHDQDVLASEMMLERQADGRFRASASGDWKVLRDGAIPDGPYGAITTDDAVFLLDAVAPERCPFDPALWAADGPTRALIERIP